MLLLLLACSGQPATDPAADALAPWPDEPEALLVACGEQPFPELAVTCRVQAAAKFAAAGNNDGAERACAGVPEGTWREECHFRAGEELGRAGRTTVALTHCARAGWFGRNCLTHTGWALPRDPALNPSTPPADIAAAGSELLDGVDQALAGAGDGLEGEGRDIVAARFGYNLYVGSGSAEPAPAHLDDPLGVVLRTGFGVEAARLMEQPTVDAIVAVWAGEAPPLQGQGLAEHNRMGRYSVPILPDHEAGIPHVPVYGGGLRLVGQTPEEDAVIAALEGLYWRGDTPADAFLPWVSDARPRVRWTAARLLRLSKPAAIDIEATLGELSESGIDEGVRWHAADGLERRSWEVHEPSRRPAR